MLDKWIPLRVENGALIDKAKFLSDPFALGS
jgi:hypothetical protein